MDPTSTFNENRPTERTSVVPVLLLTGVLLIGLSLRFAYIRLIDTPPFSDMADYETMALNLLEGRGLSMDTPHLTYRAYRPPVYPAFIASVYRLSGSDPLNVRGVQCFLSVLTVLLIYGLARRLFTDSEATLSGSGAGAAQFAGTRSEERSRWIALVAAGLYAFDETSIFFSGQLLSETLFVFFLVLWSYLLVRSGSRPNVAVATFLGLLGGLTILVRPLFGPVLLFGAYWYFRKALRTCKPPPADWRKFSFLDSPYAPPLVLLLYAGMTVSFWGFRNHSVVGSFIPTSTNSGVNFYLGHHESFGYASFGNKEGIRQILRSRGIDDEVSESRIFALQGLYFIRENPVQDFKNNLKKIYYLYLAPATWKSAFLPWKWWSYLESPYRPWPWENNRRKLRFWRTFEEGGGETLPTYRDWSWREGRLPLINWGWPFVYLTSAGIVLAIWRKTPAGYPLGLIVVYTLTLLIFFTNARFRTPLLPFLYMFAAYALVSVFFRPSGRTGKPEAVLAETRPDDPPSLEIESEGKESNGGEQEASATFVDPGVDEGRLGSC